MLQRLRKWIDIEKTLGSSGWDELVDRTVEAANQFHETIKHIPTGADHTKSGSRMNIRDIVAHVADMNFAIGNIIEGLTHANPVKFRIDDLYSGAGRRTWPDLIREHDESRIWLEEAAAKPISSLRRIPHHRYGMLSAREWLALSIYHYNYHLKQINAIMATQDYASAAETAAAKASRRTKPRRPQGELE